VYYYQSFKDSKDSLTNEDILIYKNSWKSNAVQVAKNNPNNQSFVEARITFIYNLVDKNGQEILEFNISPSEYQ
uniref:hypothetical protein n=1 Tax=Flavobacterium sp. TaxID=239 RepID=UPI002FDD9163